MLGGFGSNGPRRGARPGSSSKRMNRNPQQAHEAQIHSLRVATGMIGKKLDQESGLGAVHRPYMDRYQKSSRADSVTCSLDVIRETFARTARSEGERKHQNNPIAWLQRLECASLVHRITLLDHVKKRPDVTGDSWWISRKLPSILATFRASAMQLVSASDASPRLDASRASCFAVFQASDVAVVGTTWSAVPQAKLLRLANQGFYGVVSERRWALSGLVCIDGAAHIHGLYLQKIGIPQQVDQFFVDIAVSSSEHACPEARLASAIFGPLAPSPALLFCALVHGLLHELGVVRVAHDAAGGSISAAARLARSGEGNGDDDDDDADGGKRLCSLNDHDEGGQDANPGTDKPSSREAIGTVDALAVVAFLFRLPETSLAEQVAQHSENTRAVLQTDPVRVPDFHDSTQQPHEARDAAARILECSVRRKVPQDGRPCRGSSAQYRAFTVHRERLSEAPSTSELQHQDLAVASFMNILLQCHLRQSFRLRLAAWCTVRFREIDRDMDGHISLSEFSSGVSELSTPQVLESLFETFMYRHGVTKMSFTMFIESVEELWSRQNERPDEAFRNFEFNSAPGTSQHSDVGHGDSIGHPAPSAVSSAKEGSGGEHDR